MPDASAPFPDLSPRRGAPRRTSWAELCHWLTPSLTLVFLIGAPSLFVTRYIYKIHYPEQFVGTWPSISGTASSSPSSDFFKWAMAVVAVCIVISWPLNLLMQLQQQRRYGTRGRRRWPLLVAQSSAVACGLAAAAFLVVLSFVNLNQGHDIHMLFSILFYVAQVLAIIIETSAYVYLLRANPGIAAVVGFRAARAKTVLASTIGVISLAFLYLFLVRDSLSPEVLYPVQIVYVIVEYCVAILCFSYPLTGFADVRRHFAVARARAAAVVPEPA
jgi:hypothetical protein